MPPVPVTLRVAAGIQVAETVIVAVGTVLSAIDTARGQSYHLNSGIALTVIGAACVVALAWVAAGLARARRWSRTPALLTQFFVGVVGIYLLQGNRLEWGIPSVGLALLGFVAILLPVSQQVLSPDRSRPDGQSGQPQP
ncbi:MAG TPA: hypothetical protein VGS19_35185 [Streptosporangiaceae bacterium]|nr:hypothetical protein [Streptosporangiaceae bacterium]